MPKPADDPATPSPTSEAPVRQFLKDLATPAELVNEVERYCRCYGYTGQARKRVEQELRLQYHFGGQVVVGVDTAEGLLILAAGSLNAADFRRRVEALRLHERPGVVVYNPVPWEDPHGALLTPFFP